MKFAAHFCLLITSSNKLNIAGSPVFSNSRSVGITESSSPLVTVTAAQNTDCKGNSVEVATSVNTFFDFTFQLSWCSYVLVLFIKLCLFFHTALAFISRVHSNQLTHLLIDLPKNRASLQIFVMPIRLFYFLCKRPSTFVRILYFKSTNAIFISRLPCLEMNHSE